MNSTISINGGDQIPLDVLEYRAALALRIPAERFTKIKFSGEEVVLTWSTTRTKADGKLEHVQHTLTSKDLPAPPLVDALAAFEDEVLMLLELQDSYLKGLRVISVSLNYEEGDDRMGIVITSLKELQTCNAPLVLNTPHLRQAGEEDDGDSFIPDAWLELLQDLFRAASDYIRGIRAQGDLFA